MSLRVGVLALQGAFNRHQRVLASLGVESRLVKHPGDLDVDALIIPGGESTTMTKVLNAENWLSDIREFAKEYPVFGTCAGAILLSEEVDSPKVIPWGVISMKVQRNAYGRQVESFQDDILWGEPEAQIRLPAVFIRAPRITETGHEVEILGRLHDRPVVVRQGNAMASTFHPELTPNVHLHRFFIDEVCEHAKAA